MPMMGSKVLAATPNQGASTVYFAKDINAENFLAIDTADVHEPSKRF